MQGLATASREIPFSKAGNRLGETTELRNSSGGHPFCHENIALWVKASIVRMDKFPSIPTFFIAANLKSLVISNALAVITQMSNDLVIGSENGNSSNQLGHQHQVAERIDVRGQSKTFQCLQMLSIQGKDLHGMVRTVGHNQFRIVGIACINPDTMWRVEFTFAVSGTTKTRQPLTVLESCP